MIVTIEVRGRTRDGRVVRRIRQIGDLEWDSLQGGAKAAFLEGLLRSVDEVMEAGRGNPPQGEAEYGWMG